MKIGTKHVWVCGLALALGASPVLAASRLSIGLGQGTADGYAVTGIGTGTYLAPTATPETNVGAEYWYAFSDDYALAFSGAYGVSSMTWKPAVSGDPEIKATGTSFKVRIGGDRTGKIGERLTFFMGPGLEYWSGSQKLEVGGIEDESEPVSRIGVSGRLGGFIGLTEKIAIMGQVGHTFGYATVDDGAKTTWFPSSFNASWGLTLSL
jgi:hypothetical protein